MRWILVAGLAAGLALADGGMIGPPGETIEESGQVAVIKYAAGREDLCIATEFSSGAVQFAWVLPLPSEPTVDTVSLDLFVKLREYTQPVYRNRGFWGCGERQDGGEYWGELGGERLLVEEVGAGVIGDYSYQVLRAVRADTLESYLTACGYELPADAAETFDHYLDKDWNYFVVAQVVDSATGPDEREVGIRLSFDTDEPVYPLYVSRLGTQYSYGVVLYTLAEHRQECDDALLLFSGSVDPSSIGDGSRFVDGDYHLTKLLYYYYEDDADVVFRRAPDDESYRYVVTDAGAPRDGLPGLFLLAGAFFVWRRRRKR